MSATNENRARDLANEVDLMVWEEGHSLPLSRPIGSGRNGAAVVLRNRCRPSQSPGIIAVRSNVANYGAYGMADIDYAAVGFTP